MKKLRWQLIIIFLTGLVVGFLLIGEQPGSIAAVSAPEPVKGGIYTEALIGSLQRLNPLIDANNQPDRDVDRLLFSGLVRFDARGVPQPDLAESYGYSKDGTIYNVSLRKDAVWHDGEPVTSDDVLFTIELMRSDSSYIPEDIRSFWQAVDVNNLSEDTLQFKLPEPFAPFLDYLTFGILPEHLLSGKSVDDLVDDSFNMQPVGSGPYRFDHLVVEEGQITGVALTAFDKFYRTPAFIEQVIFRYYPDAPAALDAYRNGDIQGIGQVTADILPDALSEQNLSVYTGRNPDLSMVLFNLKNPEAKFLQEPDVRKALMYGLNRQWIVDRQLQGQAIMANGPILPGTWAYYDGLKTMSYDPNKAVDLLKEAEYTVPASGGPREKEGDAMSIELLYPDDELHTAIAEAIQRDWSKLDVEVNLVALPYDTLINTRLADRDYEAALVDLNLSRTPDPDPYPFWDQAQATGGQNYSQWDNRIASEYIEQARVTTDLADREKMYRNFQVVFQEDMPSLPLYYSVYSYAVDKEVQGVQMGPLFDSSDRFATITDWYLVSGPPSTGSAEQ